VAALVVFWTLRAATRQAASNFRVAQSCVSPDGRFEIAVLDYNDSALTPIYSDIVLSRNGHLDDNDVILSGFRLEEKNAEGSYSSPEIKWLSNNTALIHLRRGTVQTFQSDLHRGGVEFRVLLQMDK